MWQAGLHGPLYSYSTRARTAHDFDAHALGTGAEQGAQDAQAHADEQDDEEAPDKKRAKVAEPKAAATKAKGRAARKRVPSAKALGHHCAASELSGK